MMGRGAIKRPAPLCFSRKGTALNQLMDIPDSVSGAGMEFNYAVWSANTQVTLANVPWNNDYRDIVKFDNQSALDAYINGRTNALVDVKSVTYAAMGAPVRLSIPFNRAYQFNYMRVRNPSQPIDNDTPSTFYYFILDVRYVAPNTTEFIIQLDVWQTFGQFAEFGRCYIDRGHIGVANTNRMDLNGRKYLAVPEGFDLGNEYMIAETFYADTTTSETDTFNNYDVIVVSNVSWEGSGGTVDNPVLKSARGSSFGNLPNGSELYWFRSMTEFILAMNAAADVPWVTQGIVGVVAVPSITTGLALPPGSAEISTGWGARVVRLGTDKIPYKDVTMGTNWRANIKEITASSGNRYRYLDKFLTYPYCVVEATTYSGTPIILKPEMMNGSNMKFRRHMVLAPPTFRLAYTPLGYTKWLDGNGNEKAGPEGTSHDGGPAFDMMTGIMDMPTFSVVNNGYLQYMASNRNSLAFAHATAEWSQQKALTGANLGYDQTNAGMGAQSEQYRNMIAAQNASNSLANTMAVGRGAMSAIGSLSSGPAGVGSAVAAGVNTGMDIMQRNAQLAIDQTQSRQNLRTQQNLTGYNRDTNMEYAQFSAQGDYANAIAAINARTQDARLTQPSVSGQVGGDAFILSAYQWALHAIVKVVGGAARTNIGEFWLRYGYAVQRFAVPPKSLQTMTHFTYWKMRETYLRTTACPETYRQAIRGIFEKGVTVWKNPNDIGMIDPAVNEPLSGVTL